MNFSENLKLIAFLTDLLFLYQRFQKKLQADQLTIISMKFHINTMKQSLIDMANVPLFGGLENKLNDKFSVGSNSKTYIGSVELQQPRSSRRVAPSLSELRNNILCALREFLDERFEADDLFVETVEPFIGFKKEADITKIHAMVAPDLSLPDLYLQFGKISNNSETYQGLSLNEMILRLSNSAESQANFKELIVVLARIAACTPHSVDVERCISANNILKTKRRANLSIETENKYLL